ncbi:hypothetical protein GGX14DRAFT_575070 [Mycena pura]|uniref:Uncharacterized protein n=1 Tax=Mycena pura TaxID=153505 RepID=A0AAD6V377_9AGAR|nr:hypothetical protein GGX14DRAFT_575070 [Mycena pura]
MHLRNLTKIAFLGAAFALPAPAAPSFPQVTQTIVAPSHLSANVAIPTAPPFVPSADNLIVNTTVPQGEDAFLGWTFLDMGFTPGTVVHDGSAINVTMFFTAPGSVEQLAIGHVVRSVSLIHGADGYTCSLFSGPQIGFCAFNAGSASWAFVDSSVIGTYTGRWNVEFGQSTQPDAPIDPDTGCGPEPFNITTMEFVRTWEVVPAA